MFVLLYKCKKVCLQLASTEFMKCMHMYELVISDIIIIIIK